jgi:hypothetical protein
MLIKDSCDCLVLSLMQMKAVLKVMERVSLMVLHRFIEV